MYQCIMCSNKATYISNNSELELCDECYQNFKDEYNHSLKSKLKCSFDEYYEFEKNHLQSPEDLVNDYRNL